MSVISLGTWPLAGADWGRVDASEAIAVIRAALDEGVTLIDTADSYGSGRAEVLVSAAIEGRRDEVQIATKCGIAFQDPDVEINLAAGYVRHAVEQSLVRLGTDRIDLLQFHWPDGQPLEEAWGALLDLQRAGKVRYIGVSNFSVEQLQRVEAVAHIDSLQSQYSMLWRDPEDHVLPYCIDAGTGFLAYAPLSYGLLTGKYTDRAQLTDWRKGEGEYGSWDYIERLFAPGVFERNVAVVSSLRSLAEDSGISVAQLALAWLVSRPGATCAIPGARTPQQAKQNAVAADIELDLPVLAALDATLKLAGPP